MSGTRCCVPGPLHAQHQPVYLRHQQVAGQHGEAEAIGIQPEFANQLGQRADGDAEENATGAGIGAGYRIGGDEEGVKR